VTITLNEDSSTNIVLQGRSLHNAPLEYAVDVDVQSGTLNLQDQVATYTPEGDYFGTDTFTYVVQDTAYGWVSAPGTVTLKVLPVNDQPSFGMPVKILTAAEDSPAVTIEDFVSDIVTGPDNESDQTVSFILTVTNASFFATKPTITSAGKLRYKPNANVVGTTVVSVKTKDSGGTLRGGINLSIAQDITFVMTANPLKASQGIYHGLFVPTNGLVDHVGSGYFTFKLSKTGAYSGKLAGNTGSYPFAGYFNQNGHAQNTIVRTDTTLAINWQLDLTNGTDQVTGTVTNNNTIHSTLVGDRLVYNSNTNPAPQAGSYTLVIPGSVDAANEPAGDGYASLTVLSNGLARAIGKLSDGTSISHYAGISKYSHWPFFNPLLKGAGSVMGDLVFTNLSETAIDGLVTWIRPATSNRYYPAGFTNSSLVIGSPYTPPSGGRVLNTTTNLFIVSGGNIIGAVTNDSTFSMANELTVSNATVLKLSAPSSGLMTGSFWHPTLPGIRKTLRGVALQQQNIARGYFPGTNEIGAFLLLPND